MSEVDYHIQMSLGSPKKLFTPGVIFILAAIVAGLTLLVYASSFTGKYLALHPQTFYSGYVWQLVTYVFIASCTFGVLFDGLIILFIGSAIEREWGVRSL